MKQAVSYNEEHFDDDGLWKMQIFKEESNLIRVKIQSRHTSSKVYKLWIEYGKEDPISAWYCTCKTGARTIGCCAHIAAVIWHLSYDRHVDNNPRKCRQYASYVEDAGKVWETEDENSASSSDGMDDSTDEESESDDEL